MGYLVFADNYKWNQHYQLAWLRKWVVRARFWYFTKIKHNLKIFKEYNHGEDNNTIHHNLKGLIYSSGTRVLSLIHPLSAIESLDRRVARVLSIGPRTEGELFLLLGLGFQKRNIKALDLISYSPWVDLGDMHNIPYDANAFDLVLLGWVLAYSHDPALAAQHIIRVTRPGGLVAVSVEYATDQMEEEYIRKYGYQAGHGVRMRTTEAILQHFGDAVDKVYLRYDIPGNLKNEVGNLYVIFSVKK